jgi:hypothetical protein
VSSVQEKGVNGKGVQTGVSEVLQKPVSVVKKQPVINPIGLLEAILADCVADPSNFHPLKNSFKKLLQIQRSFKVPPPVPLYFFLSQQFSPDPWYDAERGRCACSILETFQFEVEIGP